jgi:hypothetical protein
MRPILKGFPGDYRRTNATGLRAIPSDRGITDGSGTSVAIRSIVHRALGHTFQHSDMYGLVGGHVLAFDIISSHLCRISIVNASFTSVVHLLLLALLDA